MQFAVIYRLRGNVTEQKERQNFHEFMNWTPPAGLEIKAHYAAPALTGIVICEAASPAALIEYVTPFTPYFQHEIFPVTDIAEALPIIKRAYDWQDSVR